MSHFCAVVAVLGLIVLSAGLIILGVMLEDAEDAVRVNQKLIMGYYQQVLDLEKRAIALEEKLNGDNTKRRKSPRLT